jgi:hypothetical protein
VKAGLKQYMPVLGMVLATVLSALFTAMQDNILSASEGMFLMISLSGAVTTYVVPRFSDVNWLKILMSGVTAALATAVALVSDGLNGQDWVMIAIQLLAGLGIVTMTNSAVPETPPQEPSAVRAQASG